MTVGVKTTNADGLTQHFGTRTSENQLARVPSTTGVVKEVVLDFEWDNLPGYDEDANQDGTLDAFSGVQARIPPYAIILSARLLVKEAFLGTTDLDIGLQTQAGAAIDDDGLVASAAAAGLLANTLVTGAGALVGASIGANGGYIRATEAGSTAGSARLIVEYVENRA